MDSTEPRHNYTNTMACVTSLWLLWGTVCSVMFCVFAQDCLDKDEIVTEMSKDVDLPSECVLSCTMFTYRQILEQQQKLTVRFKDPESGESGQFCWFIQTSCRPWTQAFVLLPINESVPDGETIQVQTNSVTHTKPVEPHRSPSVLTDDCGLRFDLTEHLNHLQEPTLCVRVTLALNTLQCPPFLVTIKNKQ